eukprot:4506191-Pyramimonas_sp.AAC.1
MLPSLAFASRKANCTFHLWQIPMRSRHHCFLCCAVYSSPLCSAWATRMTFLKSGAQQPTTRCLWVAYN